MGPGNSTADESNGVQSSTIVYDFLISVEITKQWQVQCVDINKLYNDYVMIEKKINRTAHIYITAFHIDFVRRECRVRKECRHSVE